MRTRLLCTLWLIAFSIPAAVGAQTEGTLLWEYDTGGSVHDSSPAIGPDGTVYLGARGALHAVNPDGTRRWRYATGPSALGFVDSSPAVGPDGTVYIGSGDSDRLHAVGPDGTALWTYDTGGDVVSSPAIGPDGTIYVGSRDSLLYAVNPDGSLRWTFVTGGEVNSSPAVGADGTIYFGSSDLHLYALNPDGTVRWTVGTAGSVSSSPAIGADGTVYFGSVDRKLYAVNPDGSLLWTYTCRARIESSPAIGPDGAIYFGGGVGDDRLHAVNPDGSERWMYATGTSGDSSPAVGADGVIYVGSWGHTLHAVNPDGTGRWMYNLPGAAYVFSSPAISADGVVYIGSLNNALTAVQGSSQGLAESPWPKFHQNERNTGAEPLLVSATVLDPVEFALVDPGQAFRKEVVVRHRAQEATIVRAFERQDPALSLADALPVTLPPGDELVLTLEVRPESTGLYGGPFQFTCTVGGREIPIYGRLQVGLFLNDGGERATVAARALEAFELAREIAPRSIASENNRGVLYRLLGEQAVAEMRLAGAMDRGLAAGHSYAGILMNLGVVSSDQNLASETEGFYEAALTLVENEAFDSALDAQLRYNQAWEAYHAGNLDEAFDRIDEVVTHEMANSWLLAKALVLRGAILADEGDPLAARADFESALALDPEGPIGGLAMDNLAVIDAAEGSAPGDDLPARFVLNPNYPNPFNPQTTIGFALPVSGEVSLVIYDGLGKRVREIYQGRLPAGRHVLVWDGRDNAGRNLASGVYLLEMKAGGFVDARKMTLLR